MIPGEEGYSDIFEQHRLSLFLGGGTDSNQYFLVLEIF